MAGWAAVVAVNETAADVVAHSAALASLGAQAMIVDSAAAVSANLDALQAFLDAGGGLGTITLTDGGSPQRRRCRWRRSRRMPACWRSLTVPAGGA